MRFGLAFVDPAPSQRPHGPPRHGRHLAGRVGSVAGGAPLVSTRGTLSRLNWRITLVQFLANAIVIGLLILVLPGVELHARHQFLAVLWLAAVFGVITALVRPALEFLFLPYVLQSLGLGQTLNAYFANNAPPQSVVKVEHQAFARQASRRSGHSSYKISICWRHQWGNHLLRVMPSYGINDDRHHAAPSGLPGHIH